MGYELKQGLDDVHSIETAAEALLRDHPDALVCGLGADGLICPMPSTIALSGHEGIEGRAPVDKVLAEDRATLVVAWQRALAEGAGSGNVRLLDSPARWMRVHFLDVRTRHDVLLCVIRPVAPGEEGVEPPSQLQREEAPAAPRFSALIENESAVVIECDEAFTQMFGYTSEDIAGGAAVHLIHPDDRGRATEAWVTMLTTGRPQPMRGRRARKDGTWIWVDSTLHNYLDDPDRPHVLVECIDVSAEMAAHEALEAQRELLRRITEVMPMGLLQVDEQRQVVYSNARLREILDPPAESGPASARESSDVGRSGDAKPSLELLLSTLTEAGSAAFDDALGRVLEEGSDLDIEVDVQPRSGGSRRAQLSIRALLKQDGGVSGAITCVLDITDSARARAELEQRATLDALTGAHNRSSILAVLERELEGVNRSQAALVYVDLDGFKELNDRCGHAAGDEALVEVVERLNQATRDEDLVGRLGGDEFLLLVRGLPEPELAISVARRVREALSAPFELACGSVELSASLGVAHVEDGTITGEMLVERADRAMYVSKERRDGLPVLAGADHA